MRWGCEVGDVRRGCEIGSLLQGRREARHRRRSPPSACAAAAFDGPGRGATRKYDGGRGTGDGGRGTGDGGRGRETWGKEAKVSVCQVEEAWERVGVG